jgi:hypothetical protein
MRCIIIFRKFIFRNIHKHKKNIKKSKKRGTICWVRIYRAETHRRPQQIKGGAPAQGIGDLRYQGQIAGKTTVFLQRAPTDATPRTRPKGSATFGLGFETRTVRYARHAGAPP